MVMAKKGKGDENNKVRYFLFYYHSVQNSHNDNTCPRTSMSNLSIAVSERLHSQAPVFKPGFPPNLEIRGTREKSGNLKVVREIREKSGIYIFGQGNIS
jgi:hypothetical protein